VRSFVQRATHLSRELGKDRPAIVTGGRGDVEPSGEQNQGRPKTWGNRTGTLAASSYPVIHPENDSSDLGLR
jgi:hypothetical protein